MSFLESSERLIIMDFGGSVIGRLPPNLLMVDELRALAGVGVKTIYAQGIFQWDALQPDPDKPIDWSKLDRYVDNIEAGGVKALLPFGYSAPMWKGADWMQTYIPDSHMAAAPDYTKAKPAQDLDELFSVAAERYRGRPVQWIYSVPIDGEFAFPLVSNRSEPDFPVQVFIDWVVARQRLLSAEHGEAWTSFHLIDNPSWAYELYATFKREFPDAGLFGIQFTHWSHEPDAIERVDRMRRDFGALYFCGSEYSTGLRRFTPQAIKHDCGLLCCPIGLYSGGGRLDELMLEDIALSVERFDKYVHAAR